MPSTPFERDVRRGGLLLFFIYFVQKSANHFEGFSKIPIRRILKASSEDGGFGFTAAETSAFLTNSGLGWYIKALLGFVTDRLPLFGYRRKSWLALSLIGTSIAWIWVAFAGSTNAQILLAGLVVVNILVAFSDVVTDGLMVQTGRWLERTYDLPVGTGNRPLQTMQWIGAAVAIVFGALAGGVIAQLFDLAVAAVISAALPLALAVAVLVFVREDPVPFDHERARTGYAAIGLTVVVAGVIVWMKGLDGSADGTWQSALTSWEWLISPVLILAAILVLFRPSARLTVPIVMLSCWQSMPFNVNSQWMYQYLTQDNVSFLDALANDRLIVPAISDLVVALRLATVVELAESGIQEIFYGSILYPLYAGTGIVALVMFHRAGRSVSLARVFYLCIVSLTVTIVAYLGIPFFGFVSPAFMLALVALAGFTSALATIAALVYAATVCPEEDQATAFAFLMGMSNLGGTLGVERLGLKLYVDFGGGETSSSVADDAARMLANPDGGVLAISAASLLYLGAMALFVRWMERSGLLNAEADA